MKAKDTVIPISECPYQPDGESDELYVDLGKLYQEKFMQGARKQAPISFKAGRKSMLKEVMEWLGEWCPHRDNDFPCPDHVPDELRLHKRDCRDCWQVFLKGERK